MTVARSQLVDVAVTPWYHVISKTVRGAFLLGEGELDRKQWLEDRLQVLSKVFAVELAGFAVLDNHLHLLVRLVPEQIDSWSDEEVLRRWFTIHPPRLNRQPLEITAEVIRDRATDNQLVALARQRLADLGWFMKSLKEPLARLANQADGTSGAFWQSRYKSIGILDTEALLAVCAYIDLNPLAAGVSDLPEKSPHTSIRARIEHCRARGRLQDLSAANGSSVASVPSTRGLEEDGLWLCPIEDRRQHDPAARAGLLDGFSLDSYLRLVDWTSRLVRTGKARVSPDVASLLDRLDTTAELWRTTLSRLLTADRLTG
ncbi:MAG: hypothetical protein GTO53_02765, partial [Planctomycetales bacterium]|nr:hypothetical protein [Planctomycetales bacterium]NIM08091.1 hypothetical protein [Planctomycetales bacterium]NIN07582.1 hypothetical protein [Planctomycetales bacterium]NIN76390.1 hypothetical protein [Planctomycetales bacterium]NIO33592.1 hypothetical protein [Planctomycetales bacterium]